MLFAFLGPILRILSEMSGAAHVLFVVACWAVPFLAGYFWRAWGWWTPFGGAPEPMVAALGVSRAAVLTPHAAPIDPLDQLAAAAKAVSDGQARRDAEIKAAHIAADAKEKADAAALVVEREKLAAIAATLAPPK